MKEANCDKKSKEYGLVRDKSKFLPQVASIASTGYGLAALIIGVEHKWISYKYACDRANGTLFTYQYSHAWIDFRNLEDKNGINWFENSVKATKANRQYRAKWLLRRILCNTILY